MIRLSVSPKIWAISSYVILPSVGLEILLALSKSFGIDLGTVVFIHSLTLILTLSQMHNIYQSIKTKFVL